MAVIEEVMHFNLGEGYEVNATLAKNVVSVVDDGLLMSYCYYETIGESTLNYDLLPDSTSLD